MKKVLLATAAVMLIVAASSANASWVLIPGDTTDRNLHGCGSSWEICKYRRSVRPTAAIHSAPRANGHAGGCDSLCQTKCQASWRALGFRSVNACVARWDRLNAEGTAASCETAIKANGLRPVRGC